MLWSCSDFLLVLWRGLWAVLRDSNFKWPDPQISPSKSNHGHLLLAPLPCRIFVFQIAPTSLQLKRVTGHQQRAKFVLSSCPFSQLDAHLSCLAPHFCHVFVTLCLGSLSLSQGCQHPLMNSHCSGGIHTLVRGLFSY